MANAGEFRVRVAGLMQKDDRILLISHQKNGLEYWLLPGGGVEADEDCITALVRELEEELQIRANVGTLLLAGETLGPKRHILQLTYRITDWQGEMRIGDDPVLGRIGWFSPQQLAGLTIYPDIKNRLLEIVHSDPAGISHDIVSWKEFNSL